MLRSKICTIFVIPLIRRNKPNMEIMAHVYYHVLMYMEIEFLLTTELFGADNLQFAKIMAESLSLVQA